MRSCLIFAVCGLVCGSLHGQGLREKYGTSSAECGAAIETATQLDNEGELVHALKAIETAITLDPRSLMARYMKATILVDMGEADRAATEYEWVVEFWRKNPDGPIPNVVVSAAFNLGLSAGRGGRNSEARYWLSQVMLLDMEDTWQFHWKAYRNMAIDAKEMGDGLSAIALIRKARLLAPDRVSEMQVGTYLEAASPAPVVNMLSFCRAPVQP